MSKRSYDLLTKIIHTIPERFKVKLRDVVGVVFINLREVIVSGLQKKKASGALSTDFPFT